MKNSDYKLLVRILQTKEPNLLKSANNLFANYYSKEKITLTKEYILARGNIPILLIAHLDTVFKSPPAEIYCDQEKQIMWSPQGLGADDRAGVFAIIKILSRGYRPYVCFTTGEEVGGIGAHALVRDYPKFPENLKYIVELDRQGDNDCVFYDCANDDFTAYIESFNFITDCGTFTDISILCPKWGIAGVNLSVGYVREHSFQETLNLQALECTIEKVISMLNHINDSPSFEYIPDPMANYYNFMAKYNYPLSSFMPITSEKRQCCKCHKVFSADDVFPVKAKNFTGVKYYCPDCVGEDVDWCEICGQPFEVDSYNDLICPDCAKKYRFTECIN